MLIQSESDLTIHASLVSTKLGHSPWNGKFICWHQNEKSLTSPPFDINRAYIAVIVLTMPLKKPAHYNRLPTGKRESRVCKRFEEGRSRLREKTFAVANIFW